MPRAKKGSTTDQAGITDEIVVELNGVVVSPKGPAPDRLDDHEAEFAAYQERLRREGVQDSEDS